MKIWVLNLTAYRWSTFTICLHFKSIRRYKISIERIKCLSENIAPNLVLYHFMHHKELIALEYRLLNHPILASRTSIRKTLSLFELQLFCSWKPIKTQNASHPFNSDTGTRSFQNKLRNRKIHEIECRIEEYFRTVAIEKTYQELLMETSRNYNIDLTDYDMVNNWLNEGLKMELMLSTHIPKEIVRLTIIRQTALKSNKEHLIAAAINYNRIPLIPFNYLSLLFKSRQEYFKSLIATDSNSTQIIDAEFCLADFMEEPPNYPDNRSVEIMAHYCGKNQSKWIESQIIGKLLLEEKLKIFDLAYTNMSKQNQYQYTD